MFLYFVDDSKKTFCVQRLTKEYSILYWIHVTYTTLDTHNLCKCLSILPGMKSHLGCKFGIGKAGKRNRIFD